MHDLINKETTGSPRQFAKELGVAISTLNNDIKYIRDSGILLKYDRKGKHYYYDYSSDEKVDFSCGFSISKKDE